MLVSIFQSSSLLPLLLRVPLLHLPVLLSVGFGGGWMSLVLGIFGLRCLERFT